MSKSPRKSIVASFGLLSAEIEGVQDTDVPAAAPVPAAGGRVGAGVIGAAHRAIDDIRSERDRLKALVDSGDGAIKELDPSVIEPSPFPDRLPDDNSSAFEEFKRSFESEGQKVPIQVRKHPEAAGRYQIVYGHRRWLAAKQLGVRIKALEVELSDLDLVVAQGIENASRQDLTWIERALFASRMDDAGIKPRNIYAALSIDDAELARMRSVYRAVPRDVIEAIGRSPKVGRPRWVDLAKALAERPETLPALRQVLDGASGKPSDQRFQHALNAAKPSVPGRLDDNGTALIGEAGRKLGSVFASVKEVRVTANGAAGREFLKYVETELPRLAAQFASRQGG